MTPTVVDLVTLLVMALPFAADAVVTLILKWKTGCPDVPMKTHLLVVCIGAIPFLLWGLYAADHSWHYALTFAESWGLATVLTGRLVIRGVRTYVSRHPSAHRDGQLAANLTRPLDKRS